MSRSSEATPLVALRPSSRTRARQLRSVLLAVSGVVLLATLGFVARRESLVDVAHVANSVVQDGKTKSAFFCGFTGHETDYIKLPNKKDDHYFYWFVESRSEPSKDPLVLWLTGGPGCSSMMALLAENGPCHVQPDLSTKINPYSWNKQANVIWLDQPTGVGFSYGPDSDFDSSEDNVGENIYWFLQEFLAKHPDLADRSFFITGESYGGHYVPAAASYIIKENANRRTLTKSNRLHINLAGIAIGNGLTNPAVQYQHSVEMAFNTYNVTLLDDEGIEAMRLAQPVCHELIEACESDSKLCEDAMDFCYGNLEGPYLIAGRNPYDIRQACAEEDVMKCFNFDHIDEYLNSDAVLAQLGIDTKHSKPWRECDGSVGLRFSNDQMLSFADDVALALHAGVRVLVYAGDADLMCNWIGNEAWTLELEWDGQPQFQNADNRVFVTSEVADAGRVRSFENFAFIRVFNSGHMVPMDQPAVAFDMINAFFQDKAF